jgi:putative transposase
MECSRELAGVVGVTAACSAFGMPRSSYYRQQRPSAPPPLRQPRRPHPRALTLDAQVVVRAQLNSERFVDRAPRAIDATLLDEGIRLCHWRTMYRLLHAAAASSERRAIRRHPVYARPELLATAPRQVWSWDSTKLRGPQPGSWYNLSVVLDIFSRMIVGGGVADREAASLAERLIADACTREGIEPQQLTVHADRGAPMTSKLVAEVLLDLGVTRSHSRPSVSNDNPYSEAQFKTMKYGPTYPDRFASIAHAQAWVEGFIRWYTTEHRHSGLGLLPPVVVHHGQALAVSTERQQTLDAADAAHPERFVRGRPVPPAVPDAVWINPPLPQQQTLVAAAATAAPVPTVEAGSRVSAAAAAP